MVKRVNVKPYLYLGFALVMLLMCWESGKANAMLFEAKAKSAVDASVIPQESIRLRILANSDSPTDQWIKREVRDAIIEQMNAWVAEPDGIEAARETVKSRLPELEAVVEKTLRDNGFDYTYQVELGVVPFPTKMYGNQVYPAGEYEALRVSIGEAEGQNWWCVLFPPLCFVDSEMVVKKDNKAYAASAEDEAAPNDGKTDAGAANGKAAEKDAARKADQSDKSSKSVTAASAVQKEAGAGKTASGAAEQAQKDAEGGKEAAAGKEQPEVRFFLWDMLKEVFAWFA
ncbi:stage II sporulation protein R [Paenibacillus sp. YYML68]|uniref:stage II sporulation protein R n=1 Tax=Paenibacillus sp. YYML68 TaxID=2909250 RepID=UPI00249105D4|nr:stage II sporulation protein R [Paenibacillus sp. YYML68]